MKRQYGSQALSRRARDYQRKIVCDCRCFVSAADFVSSANRVDDLPVVISHEDCSGRSVDLNHAFRRIVADDNTPASIFIAALLTVNAIESFSLRFCCRFPLLSWRILGLVLALEAPTPKIAAGVNDAGPWKDRLLHKAFEVCATDFLRIVWAQELPIIHCRVCSNYSNRSGGQKYGRSEILEESTRSHSHLRKALRVKTNDGKGLRSRRKEFPVPRRLVVKAATTRRPATPAVARRPGERRDRAGWAPRWSAEGTASMISCQSFTIGEQAVPMIGSVATRRRIR